MPLRTCAHQADRRTILPQERCTREGLAREGAGVELRLRLAVHKLQAVRVELGGKGGRVLGTTCWLLMMMSTSPPHVQRFNLT